MVVTACITSAAQIFIMGYTTPLFAFNGQCVNALQSYTFFLPTLVRANFCAAGDIIRH